MEDNRAPVWFWRFKWLGVGYLLYLAWQTLSVPPLMFYLVTLIAGIALLA